MPHYVALSNYIHCLNPHSIYSYTVLVVSHVIESATVTDTSLAYRFPGFVVMVAPRIRPFTFNFNCDVEAWRAPRQPTSLPYELPDLCACVEQTL